MALYKVLSHDVWGNAAEGYEINQSFREGEVSIPPAAGDKEVVQALIKGDYLKPTALLALEDGSLQLEDEGFGEHIEVTETETEWAGVDDRDEARYLDVHDRASAEESLEEGERAEEVAGQRPLLLLSLVEGREEAVPFLRLTVQAGGTLARLELRVDPKKPTSKSRAGKERIEVDAYVDDDFFGTLAFPKALEDEESLGIAKNGIEVFGSEELAMHARVALDAFWENGSEIDHRFDVPL